MNWSFLFCYQKNHLLLKGEWTTISVNLYFRFFRRVLNSSANIYYTLLSFYVFAKCNRLHRWWWNTLYQNVKTNNKQSFILRFLLNPHSLSNLSFQIAQRHTHTHCLPSLNPIYLPVYSQFPVDDFPINFLAMIFAWNEWDTHRHITYIRCVLLDHQNMFRGNETFVPVSGDGRVVIVFHLM